MARKPDPNLVIRPFRAWSVNGSNPEGAIMVYDRKRWMVYNWNKKTRVLTLVNETGMVSVINPLCMQWEA